MSQIDFSEAPWAQQDISSDFQYRLEDSIVVRKLLLHEATPQAILVFAEQCHRLSDYAYWFLLGTLWVSYTGWSDLALWRRLFASDRPRRNSSLMKPSELRVYQNLPYKVLVCRAARKGETDCLSYTLDIEAAKRFAAGRECETIDLYEVQKRHILALFLRRGEAEVLVLARDRVRLLQSIFVLKTADSKEEL